MRFARTVLILALAAGSLHAQQGQSAPAKRISKEEAALRAQAKVSEEAARATALTAVPNAKVKSSEIEKENGKLIWSFDLSVPGKKGIEEVNVDAVTGKVIAKEHEDAKAERAEAAADANASKAKTNNPVRKP